MTSTWGVLVLVALRSGTMRFSAIRQTVRGVSERMLSQTLQKLEQDGLVNRVSHPVVPPHVDYTLTPLGEEAAQRVQEITEWVENNLTALTARSQGKK